MQGFDSANIFLYLVILATLAIGWFLGRISRRTSAGGKKPVRNLPSRDYFIGLNYLLNDEPDDAVDIFIDALEVNSNTLETHMALGTLLRRRGKVDRSIAVYQDLLARPGFSQGELNRIKINLVQSYISAGLLDRAEGLLEDLKKTVGDIKVQALIQSANVYQLEKDWQQGVEALNELMKVCPPALRPKYQNRASHFYCELAENELQREHFGNARDFLKRAVALDRNNVRVSILLGKLEDRCHNYREAISNYLRVKKQDPAFMADVFEPLVECFKKAGREKGLQKFIQSCMTEETNTTVLLGLAAYLEKEKGMDAAQRFLLEQLRHKSSLRMMAKMLELEPVPENEPGPAGAERSLLHKVLTEYIDGKTQYQCVNCGFELKSLHWLCPSCSRWGTVKHVMGILGE